MLIRPELQALRSDDAPQRIAQHRLHQILQSWQTTGTGAQVQTELARFHSGEALDQLPVFSALFCPESDDWRGFLDNLLQPLLAQIAAQPLSQSPLRHAVGEGFTSVVLARCGTAALTLQHIDGAALALRQAAQTVSFLPVITWERALAGSVHAIRVGMDERLPDRARLNSSAYEFKAGDVHCRNGQAEALIFRSAPTSFVQLRLQRRTSTCEPVREYRLSDGCLVHQAAGTPRDSRLELTATLLGRMKRRDAAPMLAAMAEEQGSDGLRWQALRECLALDTAVGFRTLSMLAVRGQDPLHRAASALRAKLLEMHPELNGFAHAPRD